MHEMMVALEVCRIAEAHAAPLPASAITEIGVDLGDDAGVESESLRFCLGATLAEAPFAGARVALRRCEGDVLRLSYVEVEDGRPGD